MGIADTILSQGDGQETERLKALTRGQLADLVIDATGSNKSMSNALAYCASAGRLVYVGITQQEISFLHAPVMHRRELTLLASRNALPADFTRIVQLIEQGRIDTRPWITHRTDFNELANEFPVYTRPEAGVIKAIVTVA
jgi:alcohol dehydrogenase